MKDKLRFVESSRRQSRQAEVCRTFDKSRLLKHLNKNMLSRSAGLLPASVRRYYRTLERSTLEYNLKSEATLSSVKRDFYLICLCRST